jgi:hypothetical protein
VLGLAPIGANEFRAGVFLCRVPTFLRCHPSGCRLRGAWAKERAPVGGRGLRERTCVPRRGTRARGKVYGRLSRLTAAETVFLRGVVAGPGQRGVRGGGEDDKESPPVAQIRLLRIGGTRTPGMVAACHLGVVSRRSGAVRRQGRALRTRTGRRGSPKPARAGWSCERGSCSRHSCPPPGPHRLVALPDWPG